ncbi:hypothetical protein GH714_012144 [Hevea brasiliensis]|uniref:Uncharacterized protein n=1 Tax=Hevea brasiliensis TaxID=3981 RepID=A0A6A6MYA7_HEVBR|nr:hypothetical protein GH714_012144 [Hevea brasiliensis]
MAEQVPFRSFYSIASLSCLKRNVLGPIVVSVYSLLQTEKDFLKQPKVFLCSKKSGKGKRAGKVEIDSGNPLDWVSRLREKQLKELILIRNVPSLELCLSGVVS